MSTTVDNRVVSMSFENADFEKRVKESMDTLKRLDERLKLNESTRGLENVERVASRLNFSTMYNGLQEVVAHFNSLDIVGAAVLTRLTNAAINAGQYIIKAFAIDPVKTGFAEYELKMGSVQTIMASTGATLQEVNGYLAELNEYSDRTIYSFSDMTSSIGKFTNAGVSLDKAVLAIKGISNEAAVSGANAQQASHAMYNFAQALSAGAVKLIDWKSIELANMATVEFKNELIKTAVELGTLVDVGGEFISTTTNMQGSTSEAFNATKKFSESLSAQWMTTDVLIETLGRYADETTDLGKKAYSASQDVKTYSMMMDTLKEAAQSGWAETWETIVGDFEESKRLWTELSNFFGSIIQASAKARNNFLGEIFDSPWEKLIKQIDEAGINTTEFSDSLTELAYNSSADIAELFNNGAQLQDLVAEGIVSGDMITRTINKFVDSTGDAADATEQVGQKMINLESIVRGVIAGEFGNGVERMNKLAEAGYDYAVVQDMVNRTIAGEAVNYEMLTDVQLEAVGYTEDEIAAIRELGVEANKTGTPLNELIESMYRPSGRQLAIESFKNILVSLSNIFGTVKNAWDNVFKAKPTAVYSLISGFYSLTETLRSTTENLAPITKIFTGLFSVIHTLASAIIGLAKNAFGILTGALGGISFDILGMVDSIGDSIIAFNEWLNASEKLTDIWNYLNNGLSTLVDYVLVAIGGMDEFGEVVRDIFDEVVSSFGSFKDAAGDSMELATARVSEFGNSLSGRFGGIVDAATKRIEKLRKSFKQMAKSIKDVYKAIKTKLQPVIDKFKESFKEITLLDVFNSGVGVAIGAGIYKLVKMFKIGDVKSIKKSFVSLMDAATGSLKAMQGAIKAEKLKVIAGAVALLAAAILALSFVDGKSLQNGLETVSILLAEVVGTLILMDKLNVHGGIRASASIIMLSAAVAILASALSSLSGFESWDSTWPALVAMATMIGALTTVSVILSKTAKPMVLMGTALAISAMAGAFKLLSIALNSLSPDEMKTATVRMTVLTGILIVFFKMIKDTNLKGVASTLLSFSASMVIFAGAIKLMSMLKVDEVKQGLLTIAGLMLGMAVAIRIMNSANLKGVAASILAIAVAMDLMVIPIKVLGAMPWQELVNGFLAVTGSMMVMAGAIALISLTAAAPAQILALSVAMIALAAAMNLIAIPIAVLGALPWQVVALGLSAVLVAMGSMGALLAVLSPLAAGIMSVSLAFLAFGAGVAGVGAGMALLTAGLATLATVGTAGAAAIVAAFGVLLAGTIALMPQIANALMSGLVTFAKVVIDAAPIIAEAVTVVITAMLESASAIIPPLVELLFLILDTVLQALADHIPSILQSLGKILLAALDFIAGMIPRFLTAGWNIVLGIASGINQKIGEAISAIGRVVKSILDALGDMVSKAVGIASDFISGLIRGFTEGIGDLFNAAWNLGSNIVNAIRGRLDEHSPSREAENIGEFFNEGLIKGLAENAHDVSKASDKVGGSMMDALRASISRISEVLEDDNLSAPVIAPVIDLTDIQNGAKQIQALFDKDQFAVETDVSARSASNRMNNRNARANRREELNDNRDSSGNTTYEYNINNTFHITSDKPDEVANKVTVKLKRQVDRRNAVWGSNVRPKRV